jgi:hypothetical protein
VDVYHLSFSIFSCIYICSFEILGFLNIRIINNNHIMYIFMNHVFDQIQINICIYIYIYYM